MKNVIPAEARHSCGSSSFLRKLVIPAKARHSCESRNPDLSGFPLLREQAWFPASAGMTFCKTGYNIYN